MVVAAMRNDSSLPQAGHLKFSRQLVFVMMKVLSQLVVNSVVEQGVAVVMAGRHKQRVKVVGFDLDTLLGRGCLPLGHRDGFVGTGRFYEGVIRLVAGVVGV